MVHHGRTNMTELSPFCCFCCCCCGCCCCCCGCGCCCCGCGCCCCCRRLLLSYPTTLLARATARRRAWLRSSGRSRPKAIGTVDMLDHGGPRHEAQRARARRQSTARGKQLLKGSPSCFYLPFIENMNPRRSRTSWGTDAQQTAHPCSSCRYWCPRYMRRRSDRDCALRLASHQAA